MMGLEAEPMSARARPPGCLRRPRSFRMRGWAVVGAVLVVAAACGTSSPSSSSTVASTGTSTYAVPAGPRR